MKFIQKLKLTVVLAIGIFSTAQAQITTKDFSEFNLEQKTQEFNWFVTHIEEYYGLMDYKEQKWNFKWADLKAAYSEKLADPKMDRDAFFGLMQKFVSEFHDAHVSTYSFRDYLLGEQKFNTLGFFASRDRSVEGDILKVNFVIPQIFMDQNTVQNGDIIQTINGKTPAEYIQTEITPYRNLGNEESNKTYGFADITFQFNDYSSNRAKGIAEVVIKRGEQTFTRHIKWRQFDIYELLDLLNSRSYGVEAQAQKVFVGIQEWKSPTTFIGKFANPGKEAFKAKMSQKTSKPDSFEKLNLLQVENSIQKLIANDVLVRKAEPTNGQSLEIGGLPFTLVPSTSGLMAIYQIEDFMYSRISCGAYQQFGDFYIAYCQILRGEDYANAFQKLKDLGVTTLVLDTRSNGGGYLEFGYQLIRAFFENKTPAHKASIRINEEWSGTFKEVSELKSAWLPLELKEAYGDIWNILQKDISEGKLYSSPISFMGVSELTGVSNPWKGRTFVLVDEMCASMCDIFATYMQDTNAAKVIGARSMGAGGNVIGIGISPRTKIALSLTASRIFRLNGDTIENNGATPDFATKTAQGESFWDAAIEYMAPGTKPASK
ncbi:MAG: hypothetical protein J0L93_08925 [Deltaproteobacteria bacterium]|nr:hypothetical protein [Deltaproteobacteria bacterium]